MKEMKEKAEAEQFEKKLDSLNRDISSMREQKEKLKKRMDAVEMALAEKLEKRNSLIVSYIAGPLGDKEVDFRQAKYLRLQLEKGNMELEDVGAMEGRENMPEENT